MKKDRRDDWGSIRKSKSKGSYEVRYTVAGKRRSISVQGTLRDAERERAKLRMKYETYEDCDMPIGAFWYRVFHPECKTRVKHGDMSPTTLNNYEKIYHANIAPEFESTPLSELKSKDVQRWLYTMTRGAAEHAKTLLKIIMRRAHDLDYIDWHVMNKRYFMPSTEKGSSKSSEKFSLSEAEEVAKLIRGSWLELAFYFAMFGGGQRSEVLGIKPNEVEFIEHQQGLFIAAPVKQTVHFLDGEILVKNSAKNKIREGYIIVSPPYSYRLRELIQASIESGDVWLSDDGFGMPVSPNILSKEWEKFLRKNKIKHVPFANLRNSFSTNMHTLGFEDSTISKLMRHANLTTDYRNYNTPNADALIDRLASGLKS